jgi:hypothetical protein
MIRVGARVAGVCRVTVTFVKRLRQRRNRLIELLRLQLQLPPFLSTTFFLRAEMDASQKEFPALKGPAQPTWGK